MACNNNLCVNEVMDNKITFVMSSFSLVIKNILKFLTAKELSSCAQVSKVWNEIVALIKKQRHEPYLIRELSASFEKDDTLMPIYDPTLGKRFLYRLQQSWCEPLLAVIFSSNEFFFHPFRYFPDIWPANGATLREYPTTSNLSPEIEQRQSQLMTDYLKCYLPSICRFVYFCTWQLMGHPVDHSTYAWYGKGLLGMLLPSLPGLSVEPFSITCPEFYFHSFKYDELKTSEISDIPTDHKRCYLALFCKEGICILHREILSSLHIRKQDLFIGARIHQSFCSVAPKGHYQICAGLAFSGKDVVIRCFRFCSSCMKQKLDLLTSQGIPDRGIGFLFAKPCNSFAEGDCISNILHDFFPRVSVLGLTLLPNFETIFTNQFLSSFTLENKCLTCDRYSNVVMAKLTEKISIILLILY